MRGNSKSKAPFQNLGGDDSLAIQPRELEQTFCFVRHKAIDIVKKLEGQLTRNWYSTEATIGARYAKI